MDSRIKKELWGYVEMFDDKQKAIDYACWMNFHYRLANIQSGVFQDPKGMWCVCEEATRNELGVSFTEELPVDYSAITFEQLQKIGSDDEPLVHWEAIKGMVSVMDGEFLRYIIAMKIPIGTLIRYELASRGVDKDRRWCGFDKAKEIWLEDSSLKQKKITRNVNKKKLVFGISDLITNQDAEPQKYVQVFDIHGELLGEVEVYVIGYADEEE